MMCVFSKESIFFPITVCIRFLSAFFCFDNAAVKYDNSPRFFSFSSIFFCIFFCISPECCVVNNSTQ